MIEAPVNVFKAVKSFLFQWQKLNRRKSVDYWAETVLITHYRRESCLFEFFIRLGCLICFVSLFSTFSFV